MKSNLLLGAALLCAMNLLAADSTPLDDVKGAAKNLAGKPNYSWKSTTDGGNAQRRPGPVEGKTQADGSTLLSITRGDNTIEVALKGEKGAIKMGEGWKSIAEASEGADADRQNPARFIGRMVKSFKAPAGEAADLAGKAKELKKTDDAIGGDLTEDGVKELLARGPRRGGGEAPTPTGAKGSVKFWVKDGLLTKYEYKVQASMTVNGNEVNIDRTTTVEIREVGTTKVEVPEDAKKKLS